MKSKNHVTKTTGNLLGNIFLLYRKIISVRLITYESLPSLLRKYLLGFLCFSLLQNAYSQSYPINLYIGQTVNTCSGVFYDSGGPAGWYSDNEIDTVTFCSSNSTSIRFEFNASKFKVKAGDTLYVYDGPNTSSPLIGKYSETSVPVNFNSSGTCLTFKFISDNLFTRAGWEAYISCCPPPVTTPIIPSDDYKCAGSTVNYSVAMHPGSTYDWKVINGLPASQSGAANNINITWDLTGNITGSVRVVEVNSCGSKDSSELVVDIYSLPVVSFTGLDAYYCIYSAPATLTGFPVGGTFSGPGITGNTFNPGVAGEGTHTIFYDYTDPFTGCSNQKALQTTINIPAVFNVGASAASYCTGSGVSITLSGSESGVNYQLKVNGADDGGLKPGTGSQLTWVNKQSGVYTVVAIDAVSSCTNNMSGSQTITENPLPVPSFTTQPGAATCSIDNVTYTTQPGQSNYLWSFTGILGSDYLIISGGSTSDNSVTLNWKTPGSKTVTINYTNSNGCTAATPASSVPTMVIVTPAAPVGPAVQNFCTETSPTVADLNATGSGIKWYAGSSGGIALLPSTPLADATHYFASQTVTGCESTARLDVTANVSSIPAVPASNAGTGAACSQITANWTTSARASSYRLDLSTENTFGSFVPGYQDFNVGIVTSYNVTGLAAGTTYYYRIRALNYCGVSGNSATINYSTLPATPAVPGTITGTTSQCPGLTGQVYSISSVLNASIYTWSVPAGWSITSGQGSTSINVITGTPGQNGNVSVTAGNSCGTSSPKSLAVTVSPNAAITSVTGTSPLCIGGTSVYTANGVVLSGGTGAWSTSNPAVATVSAAGLVTGISAGTSDIIYTITGGCGGTVSAQKSVTISPNAAITSVTGASPLCIGATSVYSANGVVLSGGAGAWSSSNPAVATVSAAGMVTSISAGTSNIIYTITGGCGGTVSAQKSVTINPNTAITSVTGTSPLCTGATSVYTANGVVLSGGTGAWSSSNPAVATVSAAGMVTGISAGTSNIIYTVTGGCGGTVSAQKSVTINPNAAITSVTGTSPLCIGGTSVYVANGVVPGGGAGAWSSSNPAVATVSAAGLVTGISAGTSDIIYTITGGCGGTVSAQKSVTISPNAAITSVTGTSPLCIGATSVYTSNGVVLSGGAGAWSSSNPAVATVSAAGLVTGISAGTSDIIYTITGGCGGTVSAQKSVTINPNAAITSVTGTSPLCLGATSVYTANGVVLSGGTGAWSSSNPAVATVGAAGLVTGISAGTSDIIYTITGGCGGTVSAQKSVTISPNAAITSVTGTSPLCIGATSVYTANGVVLSGGTGAWSSSNPAVATVSAAGMVTGISAGTSDIIYTITGGCGVTASALQSVTISPNAAITSVTGMSPLCTAGSSFYSANGVVLSGGTGVWSSSNPAVATVSAAGLVTGVSAGTSDIIYTITGGCGGDVSAQISIIISIETAPSATISYSGSPWCSTAGVQIVTLAGTTGGNYSAVPAGLSIDALTGEIIPGTSLAGTYTVIYTMASVNCGNVITTTTVTVNSPAVIITDPAGVCTPATADITAAAVTSGSTPGLIYTYWTDAAATIVFGSPANATAGTYYIMGTDGIGCSDIKPVTVTVNPVPTVTGSQTNVLCSGGSNGAIDITAVGGTGLYAYTWTGPGVLTTAEDQSGLKAEFYTVIVTDEKSCSSDLLTVTITEPSALAVSIISQTDVSVIGGNDGSVTVDGSGGIAPYMYKLDAGTYQASGTFSSLTAGSYTVTMQDANLCESGVPVTINPPYIPLSGSISSTTHVLCFGDATGSVTVTGADGTAPYEYSLDGVTYQPSGTFSLLAALSYTVTVKDALLNTYPVPVIITQPAAPLTVTTTQLDVLCKDGNSGSATAAVMDGTAPYTYLWNTTPVQAGITATDLSAGSYIVEVTDANGCKTTKSVTILEPAAALSIAATPVDARCPDSNDGSINLEITGGTIPYSANWNDAITTQNRTAIPPETYSVVVIDANWCQASTTTVVSFTGYFDCLVIPDIITPDPADGYNDEWIIRNIDIYPNAELLIYTRWGKLIYKEKNISAQPWNGRYSNGKLVPTDSYHYILYLNDGSGPRSGVISVIR